MSFLRRLFNPLNLLISRFYTLNEIFRLAFMLGMIALLFSPDYGALKTMMYVMGVFLAIAFIAHITRKYAMFHYVDMKTFAMSALEERNVAAAIVFASMCSVVCTCIIVAGHFFSR